MIPKIKLFMLSAMSLVVVAMLVPPAVHSQVMPGPPCKTCIWEGAGFAKCVDAPFGSEGWRSCFGQGTTGCIVDFPCLGDLTEAERVTPAGRASIVLSVLVANEGGDLVNFRPTRLENCNGVIFALQYAATAAEARLFAQQHIRI